MIERYQRQSALAHLHLAARAAAGPADAAVRLSERPFRGRLNLRGDPGDETFPQAVTAALGVELPRTPNTFTEGGGRRALWLGPDEWLVALADGNEAEAADALRAALAGQHAAVTEVGHAYAVIGLSGQRAREMLRKGCGLDLHPRVFAPGRCAQTQLARADMLLAQTDDDPPAYEIAVRRSFAHYAWTWLEDAAAEYGFAVDAA